MVGAVCSQVSRWMFLQSMFLRVRGSGGCPGTPYPLAAGRVRVTATWQPLSPSPWGTLSPQGLPVACGLRNGLVEEEASPFSPLHKASNTPSGSMLYTWLGLTKAYGYKTRPMVWGHHGGL